MPRRSCPCWRRSTRPSCRRRPRRGRTGRSWWRRGRASWVSLVSRVSDEVDDANDLAGDEGGFAEGDEVARPVGADVPALACLFGPSAMRSDELGPPTALHPRAAGPRDDGERDVDVGRWLVAPAAQVVVRGAQLR